MRMRVKYEYLFNFAASYSGGGFKRLHAYANWFNGNGGARFVINPRCAHLKEELPRNQYFVANQSRFRRVFDDCAYLSGIGREIGTPELYYSYGIPLYSRFGTINWFHLSNVLPLCTSGIPLSLFDRGKAAFLGKKIQAGLRHADVISAESKFSLSVMSPDLNKNWFVSVNGSDDELRYLRDHRIENKEETAILLGTQRYKAVDDSVAVFRTVQKQHRQLKLVILGNPKYIPRKHLADPDVVIRGILDRDGVLDCLRKAKLFISTTFIENSYNAASEGIFMADESFISDIGPHRELLENMPYQRVSVPGVDRQLLLVNRATLSGVNLKSWNTIVVEMIDRHLRAMRER
jgi:glycosyltransferase involved in cell wall biosynthesis